jgi:hypothetical protein
MPVRYGHTIKIKGKDMQCTDTSLHTIFVLLTPTAPRYKQKFEILNGKEDCRVSNNNYKVLYAIKNS